MTYSPDTLEAMARLGLPMEEMDLEPAPAQNVPDKGGDKVTANGNP